MNADRLPGLIAVTIPSVVMLFLGWIFGRAENPTPPNKGHYFAWFLPVRDSATTAIRMELRSRYDDTLVNDSIDLILQNALGDVQVQRWYHPRQTFEDFPVREIFSGIIPAKLNFSTCEWGREYKTMTRYGLRDGVAFAGHYAFASWGCGCPCQECSIIDLYTGNVYAGPMAANGYEFRVDSRLLIVNPPGEGGLIENCAWCTPEQYLWTGTTFKRVE